MWHMMLNEQILIAGLTSSLTQGGVLEYYKYCSFSL